MDNKAVLARGVNDHRLARVLFLIFLAIVLVLGGMAAYVWNEGQAIRADVDRLARQDLAALNRIHALQVDVLRQSMATQRLYATADTAAFVGEDKVLQPRVDAGLQGLDKVCQACSEIQPLIRYEQNLKSHVFELLDVMLGEPVDWDAARSHLYAADTEVRAMEMALGRIQSDILARVERSRVVVEETTHQAAWRVSLIALGITVLAFFFGYYTWRNVIEARTRRRLALFPERNPLPVFSLSMQGAVIYANPAARAMADALFGSDEEPGRLLPADLVTVLGQMHREASEQARWEYALGAATVQCGIHCMRDLDVCHAYVRDITAQRAAEAQIRHQAMHDAITDLPNQRAFHHRVDDLLAASATGAVLLVYVDRFHGVIETLGHAAGEQLLRAIGERLRALVGAGEPACCVHRFEGELFAMLLATENPAEAAHALAQRIVEAMHVPVELDERALYFSVSLGLAHFPVDGQDRATLLRHADTALRHAIRAGGNSLRRYQAEMDERALARLELEHALRHVEQRGELALYFQPQVEIASGRIIGLEALVRWLHPEKGLISPADFIPLAEDTGTIIPMGEWILATACAQNKAWQDLGLPPVIVAVNLSPKQFQHPGLPDRVRHSLEQTGLDPAWLELEVTEGAAMQDLQQAAATLRAFKDLGVRLSIDDFGTGHSSLAYLSRFPIDKLKVDQSFVRNMERDPGDAAIARSVVSLGHSLGLTVIAEGVETAAQHAQLRQMGCDEIQGYLFSKPLPGEAVAAVLARPPWLANAETLPPG